MKLTARPLLGGCLPCIMRGRSLPTSDYEYMTMLDSNGLLSTEWIFVTFKAVPYELNCRYFITKKIDILIVKQNY
jgi:hypothetical protein